jgi:hypothetical protein
LFFVFALTQISFIQKKTFIGRYYKAYYLYKMAKKFPPTSSQHQQYVAIAKALFYNQKEFKYETSSLPTMPLVGK